MDPKNTGILIPANRAEGRTKLDGSIVKKTKSTELIRVRSYVVSKGKEVTRDHLSYTFFGENNTPAAIGLRVMTTLTEQFTQSGLSLKHSGSFISVPEKSFLKFDGKAGKYLAKTDDKKIILTDQNGKVAYEYPLPNEFDILNKNISNPGDTIGTSLIPGTAGIKLDMMIKIMGAKSAMVDQGLEKNNLVLSPCYAPIDGVVTYDFEQGLVFVGGKELGKIQKDAVYYYPNGAKVAKFTKIMSDPFSAAWYLDNNYPVEDVYFMFRKEFIDLAGNLTEELFEILFRALTKVDSKTGKMEYLGSHRGMTKGSESFFAQMSFERGKAAISKLASGDLKFEDDVFTRNVLDFMIMSAKQDKKVSKK